MRILGIYSCCFLAVYVQTKYITLWGALKKQFTGLVGNFSQIALCFQLIAFSTGHNMACIQPILGIRAVLAQISKCREIRVFVLFFGLFFGLKYSSAFRFSFGGESSVSAL